MADSLDLESRIRRLEDIEAIKQLKDRYFLSGNLGKWDEAADCFTDTAYARYGPIIECKGKKAINEFLSTNPERMVIHHKHSHAIDITSDATAKGICNWQVMLGKSGQAYWAAGIQEDEYVKVNGQWKMQKLVLTFHFLTEYEQGWVKQRMTQIK